MNEAELLFFQCCERIDEDVIVAEEYLVGCVMWLKRDRGEKDAKSSRKYIENDFSVGNYDNYLRDFRLISTMRDDALEALVFSTIDYSIIEKKVRVIHRLKKNIDKDDTKETPHMQKVERSITMLQDILEYMKPTTKVRTDCSLFEEVG